MILSTTVFAALAFASTNLSPQDNTQDWPGWRGPGGNGVAAGSPPTEWSEDENLRWKTAIPGRGLSSPVTLGSRIFLTTAVPTGDVAEQPEPESRDGRGRGGRGAPAAEQDFVLMALDHGSGEILWDTIATTATPHEGMHRDSSFATPTLVTDGKRLFASFGSAGIFAYDLEGKLLWQRDLGDMTVQGTFGEGTSPVLADDKLVVLWQHNGDSFLVALNLETGKDVWRRDRESGTSWCTPTVVAGKNDAFVVVPGPTTVAYAASNGKTAWTYAAPSSGPPPAQGGRGGRGGDRISSVHSGVASSGVAADGVVYVSTDRKRGSFLALLVEGVEGTEDGEGRALWTLEGDTPHCPSPVLYDGILYSLKSNSAILSAIDAATGQVLYSGQRLEGMADAYASPVAADGRLFFSGRDGTCEVVRAGAEFKTLAINTLDDAFDASPAIVGDTLLLRGRSHLYCIGSADL